MEFYSKGNEAFVAEDYEKAVQLYTDAIAAESDRSEFYSNRSQSYVKLEKYADALSDAVTAIDLDANNAQAYLRKGIAQYHMKDHAAAKESFTKGQDIDGSVAGLSTWLEKCETELKNNQPTTSQPTLMPTGPKVRHDWYQTESQVVITIMLKKVRQEDLDVNIQPRSFSATVKLSAGSDYSLELDLLHEIVPEKSSTKILSTKIEIKLFKKEGIRWTSLEGEEPEDLKHFQPEPNKYPTSSHYTRNWDKLAQEITQEEKDKLEGDAALNDLFQKIYSDGNDEVRKAMNKSFQESGGTVLSTNWSEIGNKKTDCKPPDGMEYKKY